MSAESLTLEASTRPRTRARSRRRNDIQGLRALLMIQVLVYHAWHIGSPIGVDSFIMISAFLMTASFVRRSEGGKMPSVVDRWASTFKRLLPSLTVVVLLTLIGSFLLLTADRWRDAVTQAFASMTYWENWWLADNSVDYYAFDHAVASPFQHLWSMSMQGQMFLLWPVLMAAAVFIAKRMGWSIRVTVASAFGILSALSLAWLVFWAPSDASVYFDTRARIWEFAFGSAVAALVPFIPTPRWAQRPLGWLALTVLLIYCFVSIGQYPGPMALVPLTAVSILLLIPAERTAGSASRLLAAPPLVWLGNISYAVYLIHWPVFVFFLAATGRENLGARDGVALIALSIALAWVLTVLVDRPAQFAPWSNRSLRNKLIVVSGSLCLGLGVTGIASLWLTSYASSQAEEQRASTSTDHPGARVLDWYVGATASWEARPIPYAISLGSQWATWPEECAEVQRSYFKSGEDVTCSRLNAVAADETNLSVLVVGDSHAEQNLLPPLETIVIDQGWSGTAILKGGCPFVSPGYAWSNCDAHNEEVLSYIAQERPDIVFVISTATTPDSPDEAVRPGFREVAEEITRTGATVVGLRDNLRSERDLYRCSDVIDEGLWGGCLLQRDEYFAAHDPADALADIDGFFPIDLTDSYCTEELRPTIVGNVFVYLDENHVTLDYSRTVTPAFYEAVRGVLAAQGLG